MAERKITTKQVMDYLEENKPDGKINRTDVRNAMKALGGTMESMSGLGIAGILKKLSSNKPVMQAPRTTRPTPGPIGPRSKDTFNDKPPAEKANSGAKQLKRGGPVRKSKKSGRLAMRGYGKARK